MDKSVQVLFGSIAAMMFLSMSGFLDYVNKKGYSTKVCQKIATQGFGIEAVCPNGVKHVLPFDKKKRTYPKKYEFNSKKGLCTWDKISTTWTCGVTSIPCTEALCSVSEE